MVSRKHICRQLTLHSRFIGVGILTKSGSLVVRTSDGLQCSSLYTGSFSSQSSSVMVQVYYDSSHFLSGIALSNFVFSDHASI